MSKAADEVRTQMSRYITAMADMGKKPSCVHITQKQCDTLRKEFNSTLKSKGKQKERDKASFRPMFRGFELHVVK